MAGNCGVCGESCEVNPDSVKCAGSCDTFFHLSCISVDGKTRGSKKDYMCEKCKRGKSTSSLDSSKSTPGTVLTKEFLVKMFEAFKTEVFGELKNYGKELIDFRGAMDFFSGKLDDTNKHLEESNKNYNEMKKEVEELKQKNLKLTLEMKETQIRLRNMEQYSRKCNVEISGIPLSNNEDVISVVEDVGKAIGVPLRREEVAAAHRVPSFRKGRMPPLIVQFSSRITRDQWITKAKGRRDLTADNINKNFPRSRVFISEHLTPETKVLLTRTKDKCRELGWRYVWCKEGKVFCRRDDGERCVRVDSLDDVAKLE